MGISNVRTSRDLSSAIYYMAFAKGHNGHDNRYITSRLVNCTEYGCIQQTKAIREYYGKNNNVHGLTFVFSFSDREISLFERDKQEKMMDSLKDVLHERYGNRQIGLFGQIDGDGQKFHIHAFVNSPELSDGKLIDGRLKLHENARDMLTDAMNKAGIDDLNKDVPKKQAKKTNIAIIKTKEKNPNAYIWLEDLQNRIKAVMSDKSILKSEEFMNALFVDGVTMKTRRSSKTKSGVACSYSFVDKNGKNRIVKAGKLGTDFQIENIQAIFRQNAIDKQKEIEERKRKEIERRQIDSRNVRQKQVSNPVAVNRPKIDSKPLVSTQRKNILLNRSSGSERLSEAHRDNLERKTVNNTALVSKSNVSDSVASEPRLENPLLNYIKTNKFIMYQEKGRRFPQLGDEPRTFEEHANIRANRSLSDNELLHYAEVIKFSIPSKNYEGKLICNTKPITLKEKFEKTLSKDDLMKRYSESRQERSFEQNVQTHYLER